MIKIFDGVSKKLAIPVFVLFAIGWAEYTAGFGLVLDKKVVVPSLGFPFESSITTPLLFPFYLFPFYFTLAGGPFVVTFGVLHAALPSNQAGAIIGVLSTILNNIYFVSVGFILFYSRLLSDTQLMVNTKADESLNLMFAGAIILTVSWSFLQILAVFFKQPQQRQSKNWWSLIVGIYKILASSADTRFDRQPLLTRSDMIRLLSIPTIALSVVGWGVYVGGIHDYVQSFGSISTLNFFILKFTIWGSIIITPFAFLIALLQAGSSGPLSTVFGILLLILNTSTVIFVGFVVTIFGHFVFIFRKHLLNTPDLPQPLVQFYYDSTLIFGGEIICIFFWMALMAISRFYTSSSFSARPDSTSTASTPNDQMQHSPAHHKIHNTHTAMRIESPPPAYGDLYEKKEQGD